MNKRNRILSILLALAMIITYMPGLAFALDEPVQKDSAGEPSVIENAGEAEESTGDIDENDSDTKEVAAESAEKPDKDSEAPQEKPAAMQAVEQAQEPEAEPVLVDGPSNSEEDVANEENTIIVSPASIEPETVVPDVSTSDDLLQEYVDEKVAEEIRQASGKAFSKRSKSKLQGAELNAYNALVPLISKVASGDRKSTVFEIPATTVYGAKASKKYTAKDLGVSNLLDGNEISEEAVNRFYAEYVFDVELVIHSLLSDMPYECYWFDKVKGVRFEYPYVSYKSDSNGAYLTFSDTNSAVSFSFIVSSDYSANAHFDDQGVFYSGDSGTTSVNQTLTRAAANAAGNIAETISTNKDKVDYEKLVSYKNTIIGLTDYNNDALAPNYPYGDPWQLIFVFDNNPNTNVVCEGYSKAFQYLCDNTLFDHAAIECWSVTGVMSGGTGEGNHMWNILHMEDGHNYIADLTNSDSGTIGKDSSDPDGSTLFLNGFESGDFNNGYTYSCGDSEITYAYDKDTKALFSQEERTMSPVDYSETFSDINELDLTLSAPACGTDVKATGPKPEIKVKSDRVTTVSSYWVKDGKEFSGKMLGGEKYTAYIVASIPQGKQSDFNYTDNIIVKVNGTTVSASRISGKDAATVSFSVDIKAAHGMTSHAAVAATCTKAGNNAYWSCGKCGKYFSDSAGTKAIAKDSWIVAAKGHKLTKHAAVAATVSKAGSKAYWSCNTCGKFFGDSKGTKAITKNSWVIPKLISISKATVTGVANKGYTGKALAQKPVVKLGGKTLVSGKDYKLSYKNNTKVGTATVTITGAGAYGASLSKTFKINPKGTSISKLTAAKKGFTAKWNKQATQTTGYELQYALNKTFTSGRKTVIVANSGTISKKVTKLKKKKKYFVRVRTYKTVSGKKYYSAWSAVKTIKTK